MQQKLLDITDIKYLGDLPYFKEGSWILNLSLFEMTTPLNGFYNSLMNQKKPKDEEKIRNEQSELWKHIFINGYFQFAYRTNDEKYNVLQIYGKYCLYYRPYTA